MIAITDYGMGNLGSVKKALDYLGAPCQITKDPQLIRQASHVILPGVGAFADAMDELERRSLVGPLEEAVNQGKPLWAFAWACRCYLKAATKASPGGDWRCCPGGWRR